MARLIDIDNTIEALEGLSNHPFVMTDKQIKFFLTQQPTIESEPVKHGKWINEPPYISATGEYLKGQECSICHSYFVSDGNKPYSNHPYCCECGTRMDG